MKKVISVLTAMIIFLSLSVVLYGDTPCQFTVEGGSGAVGEIVTVNISLAENSNATDMKFTLHYDSARLKLSSYDIGDLSDGLMYAVNEKVDGQIIYACISANEITRGGSFIKISFEILSTDDSSTQVPLTLEVAYVNRGDTSLAFAATDGSINIDKQQTINRGDADKNGVFDENDLIFVRNYILKIDTLAKDFDINGDGVCDISELVKLRSML